MKVLIANYFTRHGNNNHEVLGIFTSDTLLEHQWELFLKDEWNSENLTGIEKEVTEIEVDKLTYT